MNLEIFKREFDYRHDWDIEEENVLKTNWPNIKFHNVPLAWIIPIDDLLQKVNKPIKEIRQEYGQLIILHDLFNSQQQQQYINDTEEIIQAIDLDLFMGLI